jgi:predicted AAA+ superfamily ATPase
MIETYVLQNLSTILEAHLPHTRVYFWHVQGRYEVDFIIEFGRACAAIEVKAASRWGERDLAGLKAFMSTTPSCQAAILAYNGNEAVQLDKTLWAIPMGMLLS